MAKCKQCPDCGANLDHGETCDCKKEKGLPRGHEDSPKGGKDSEDSIPQLSEDVKTGILTELRRKKHIAAKDIVEAVRKLYPKYDKTLQSKCEHGTEYGIQLRCDAVYALLTEFAPELLEAERHRRNGRHRLKCSVSCRLHDEDYAELIKSANNDGFDTIQSLLTHIIREYLKSKRKDIS